MKAKNKRQKAIPHCYRRNLSRTLSSTSVSQLVQLGSYKKRINDLSRNNRMLATALQEARIEVAARNGVLVEYAKASNNILFARFKFNEIAKNLAKFVTDFGEARSYLNTDFADINNPISHNKRSPIEKVYDKICKEPIVNHIEEVSREYSENEVVASENFPADSDPMLFQKSDSKISGVCPRTSGYNVDVIDEDIAVAPILFADDSEEKKKKTSGKSKSRSSKVCHDPDKESLTPQLNSDLTSVKLKRNSSRRQTQFLFPDSRSTSGGKITSSGKENSPEEMVTPVRPATPPFIHQEQNAKDIQKHIEETIKSPISNNNIRDKESKNPSSSSKNYPKFDFDANQCDFSYAFTVNSTKNLKTVVAGEVQPVESNHTVLLCEDMELIQVIRPVHQIVIGSPPKSKLDNSDLNCVNTKENNASNFSAETKENIINTEIISEKDSLKLLNTHPNTPKLPTNNDNDIQIPEINEHDEIQNVGRLTFCEPDDDTNNASRTTKSSYVRSCRSKPVKYYVFFSSDESDEDSPFKMFLKKGKTNKLKSVSSTKIVKPCEKTENTVNQHKGAVTKDNKLTKNDTLKCTVDVLSCEKTENTVSQHKGGVKKDKLTKNDTLKSTVDVLSCENTVSQHKDAVKKDKKKTKNDILKCTVDVLHSRKEDRKSPKKLKHVKPSSKKDFEDLKDFEELFEHEAQTKTSCVGADKFSESTNNQKLNDPVLFNFSDDTEMYNFQLPSSSHFSTIPTTDDLLLSKSSASSNATEKNANKNSKYSKKVPVSKPVKGKLSLKKNKDPKGTEPQHIFGEIVKEKFNEKNTMWLESPVSEYKPVKRKNLFKENLDDDLKESVNFDHQSLKKPKNILKENSESQRTKSQGKVSTKNMSDKPKLLEPTPGTKRKKTRTAVKCFENSPVLKDTVNLPDMQDGKPSRKKSTQICYKEPSLNKKLRRE